MRSEQDSRRRSLPARRQPEEATQDEQSTPTERLHLQRVLGNGLVGRALTGGMEGFGSAVRDEATYQAAGMILPDRSSSDAISQPGQVRSQIGRSSGAALPGAIARRLSSFLGHDVGHARVHTDSAAQEATSALHARAFALGADVFFAPGQFRPGTQSGDQLLAHELTHVMQFDRGQIGGGTGLDVSSPSDALEGAARQAAANLSDNAPREIGAPTARSAAPGGGVAHRDAVPGAAPATRTARPARLTLGLGGWTFQVSVPSTATPGGPLNLPPPTSAIPGLTLRSLRVDVGSTFGVEGGQLTGSVSLGSHVTAPEALLRISEGGQINGRVDDARLDLGTLGTGRVNLSLSSTGISGSGTLRPSDLHLEHGLTLHGGAVSVGVDTAGAVSGSGQLAGQIPNIGGFQLAAQLQDTTLQGALTVDFATPVAFGSNVSITSGHLSGGYSAEAVAIQGVVALDLGAWATGMVSGNWSTETGLWSAAGALAQVGTHALGDIAVSAGVIQAAVADGQVQPMSLAAEYTAARGFQGHIQGAYDPATDQFDGRGSATFTQPWQLGSVNLTAGSGELTVTANQLVAFDGAATAEVPWQGTPTFHVLLDGLHLDMAATTVSGTGAATTTRELVFGEETPITIPAGTEFTATLVENELTAASGTASFRVADRFGEFGEGTAEIAFDPATGTVSGSATFAFTTNYGFPERASETSYFKPGGSVTATFTAGTLERADINLPYAVLDPAGGGMIEGSLVGTLVFATATVDGTGTGAFTQPWPVPVDFGTFQFVPGGSVTATVTAGSLSRIEGDLPFETEITGEPTLKFDGRVAGTLDVPAAQVDGSAELTLSEEAPFALNNGDEIVGAVGSTAHAEVAANQIEQVAILLQAIYRSTAFGDLATGTLEGNVKVPSGLFTGEGDLTLNEDLPLAAESSGGNRPEEWSAWLDAGANVHSHIVDDAPERTTIAANGHLNRLGERVATATLGGEYLLGDTAAGFTGQASAEVIQRFDWSEGGRFTYQIDEGTHLDAAMEASQVTQASGTVRLAILEGGADKAFATFSANYTPGTPLTGAGTAEVVDDILLATRGDSTLFLAAGSAGNATIADDQLSSLDGTLLLRLDRAGTPLLGGDLSARWEATEADANVDALGQVTLLSDLELGSGHEYRFWLVTGSAANALVIDSELDSLDGSLDLRVDDDAGPFVSANLTGAYQHPTPTFTGQGSATVIREKDLEAATGPYRFWLLPGSGVTADVADLELVALGGTLGIRVDDPTGQLLQLDLAGTYTHAGHSVSGTATATLLRRYDLGSAGEYQCFAEPGSGLVATVADNALSEITGEITASVDDAEGTFLQLTGTGRYSFADPKALDFTGAATIQRERKLGESGRFAVYVIPGTGASATVEQNSLTSLNGLIHTRIDVDGTPFANVDLSGSWSEDAGFTGTGAAELIVPEWQAAEMGSYTLWLMAGGGTQIDLEGSAITRLSAQLPIKIKEGGAEFMSGNVQGEYLFAEQVANGTGSLTVVSEKQLPTGGSAEQFWLLAGSGANVTIGNNDITHIGGNVHLGMRDGAGQYLDILFEGTYDTVEGVFDGSGGATITREKHLPTASSPFALAPGAGARATITHNEVTSVSGSIPFFVYSNGARLLRGQVNGDWEASTNLINGTGEVFLASDQTFGPIRFREGSGGTGEVVDSQLTRFTGTILAVLSDSQGDLVDLSASGEFDAINNRIVRAEGGATMLRKLGADQRSRDLRGHRPGASGRQRDPRGRRRRNGGDGKDPCDRNLRRPLAQRRRRRPVLGHRCAELRLGDGQRIGPRDHRRWGERDLERGSVVRGNGHAAVRDQREHEGRPPDHGGSELGSRAGRELRRARHDHGGERALQEGDAAHSAHRRPHRGTARDRVRHAGQHGDDAEPHDLRLPHGDQQFPPVECRCSRLRSVAGPRLGRQLLWRARPLPRDRRRASDPHRDRRGSRPGSPRCPRKLRDRRLRVRSRRRVRWGSRRIGRGYPHPVALGHPLRRSQRLRAGRDLGIRQLPDRLHGPLHGRMGNHLPLRGFRTEHQLGREPVGRPHSASRRADDAERREQHRGPEPRGRQQLVGPVGASGNAPGRRERRVLRIGDQRRA